VQWRFFALRFLTLKLGDRDFQIGLHELLKIILNAVDREVDRDRAFARNKFIQDVTEGLKPEFGPQWAVDTLVPYCLGLMQNVSETEQDQLSVQNKAILSNKKAAPQQRVQLILLQLLPLVGERIVREAVQVLTKIEPPPLPVIPPPPELPEDIGTEKPPV
jgi:hypothetical protein